MMLFFSFDLLPGFYRGYYDIQWSTWCLLSALLVSSGTLLLWRPKNQAPNGAGWRWTLWSFSKKKQGKHRSIFGFFRGRIIGNLETSPQFVAKRPNEGVWLLRGHIWRDSLWLPNPPVCGHLNGRHSADDTWKLGSNIYSFQTNPDLYFLALRW